MSRFVTIKKFTELTGYTRSAIDKRRARGEWREGEVVLKAPNGDLLMNIEAYEQWVVNGNSVLNEQGLNRPVKRVLKSVLPMKGYGVGKGSDLSPPPLT